MTDVISVTVVDEEDVVPGTGAAVGGARWYSAAGVPSPAVGNPNDFYLDSETGLYYEKVGSDWENRGDLRSGDVTGPASSTDGRVAVFSGSSGKILIDSGVAAGNISQVGHTHSIANVTGLQTALDSKANLAGGNAFSGQQTISGSVGIGTGSPGAMLDVQGFTRIGGYGGTFQGLTIINNSVSSSLFGTAFIDFQNENNVAVADIFAEMDANGRGQMAFDVTAPGARNSDRRRRSAAIAAGATSGSFVITGIGGFSDTEGRIDIISDSDGPNRESFVSIRHRSSAVNGNWYAGFLYNNNVIGSITQAGTTGVAYGTASDYRLKGNVTPMTNRLAAVMALNPVTYTWNSDGSAGQGFLAHELQAVIPDAVTGEKDAEDADGNPVYQGVDFSRVVPTLVAAIQEQQAQIAALTVRIEALENAA